ncbi:unnamed protein product [Trichogramma brassicae]|uniref:Ionotropic glutamate receptor C-terminal domain-containing protein n=1 Tax=Trichogramma brassicae TaxID=86971 RepID=A0A6H5IB69_9HYME|nr:unnamed protein product [Trichogramma brassicae]
MKFWIFLVYFQTIGTVKITLQSSIHHRKKFQPDRRSRDFENGFASRMTEICYFNKLLDLSDYYTVLVGAQVVNQSKYLSRSSRPKLSDIDENNAGLLGLVIKSIGANEHMILHTIGSALDSNEMAHGPLLDLMNDKMDVMGPVVVIADYWKMQTDFVVGLYYLAISRKFKVGIFKKFISAVNPSLFVNIILSFIMFVLLAKLVLKLSWNFSYFEFIRMFTSSMSPRAFKRVRYSSERILLCTIILLTSYSSSYFVSTFSAVNTVDDFTSSIETIENVKNDTRLRIFVYEPLVHRISRVIGREVISFKDIYECINKRLRDDRTICIGGTILLTYHHVHESDRLHVSRPLLSIHVTGYFIRPDWFLKPKFNYILLRFYETGITRKFKDVSLANIHQYEHRREKSRLGVAEMNLVLPVIFGGFLLAIIVFVLERLIICFLTRSKKIFGKQSCGLLSTVSRDKEKIRTFFFASIDFETRSQCVGNALRAAHRPSRRDQKAHYALAERDRLEETREQLERRLEGCEAELKDKEEELFSQLERSLRLEDEAERARAEHEACQARRERLEREQAATLRQLQLQAAENEITRRSLERARQEVIKQATAIRLEKDALEQENEALKNKLRAEQDELGAERRRNEEGVAALAHEANSLRHAARHLRAAALHATNCRRRRRCSVCAYARRTFQDVDDFREDGKLFKCLQAPLQDLRTWLRPSSPSSTIGIVGAASPASSDALRTSSPLDRGMSFIDDEATSISDDEVYSNEVVNNEASLSSTVSSAPPAVRAFSSDSGFSSETGDRRSRSYECGGSSRKISESSVSEAGDVAATANGALARPGNFTRSRWTSSFRKLLGRKSKAPKQSLETDEA